MASNYTPEFGLNQWSLEDSVIMEEFNTDNRKIEQALLDLTATLPKVQTGSFTLTEQHGEGNPFSYAFDVPPKVVFLVQEEELSSNLAPTVLLRGVTKMVCAIDPGNDTSYKPEQMTLTWDGNTITWYTGYYKLPKTTYHFLAIG